MTSLTTLFRAKHPEIGFLCFQPLIRTFVPERRLENVAYIYNPSRIEFQNVDAPPKYENEMKKKESDLPPKYVEIQI